MLFHNIYKLDMPTTQVEVLRHHPTSQMGKLRLRTYISSLSTPSVLNPHRRLLDGNERTQGGGLLQADISHPPSTTSRHFYQCHLLLSQDKDSLGHGGKGISASVCKTNCTNLKFHHWS